MTTPTLFVPLAFEDKQFWLAAALADIRITPAAKVVATALYMHHNSQTGRCNPGYATLVETCGMSKQAIQRAIKNLRSFGYLDVTPGQNETSSAYRLTLPASVTRSSLTKNRSVPEAFGTIGVGSPAIQGGVTSDTPCIACDNTLSSPAIHPVVTSDTGCSHQRYQIEKEQGMNREAEQGMNREENNDGGCEGARSPSARCAPLATVISNPPAEIIPFPVERRQTPPASRENTPPAAPPSAAWPFANRDGLSAWLDRIENPEVFPKATFKNILPADHYRREEDLEEEINAILCGT